MRRLIEHRTSRCIQESMDLPAAARSTKNTIEGQVEEFCVWPFPNTDVVVQIHGKGHDQRRFGIGVCQKDCLPPFCVLGEKKVGLVQITA